jgi:transcriptional antiterminator NusG
MARRWYAVHTISGHEKKVKELLTRRATVMGMWGEDIVDILIPTEQELTSRNGKRVIVDKKVFPGYIMVNVDLTDDAYKLIKSTSGVTGFISSGAKPVPMEDYEVKRIMRNLEASQEAPKVAFSKGEIVRVIEGPFADYTGRIEDVNPDREQVQVMITIFGRDTPVWLEFTKVEKQ